MAKLTLVPLASWPNEPAIAGTRLTFPKGKIQTFTRAGERICLEAISQEWEENQRRRWSVRHYYYVLKNTGLLKTLTAEDDGPAYRESANNAQKWVSDLLKRARERGVWGEESWNIVVDSSTRRGVYRFSGTLADHIADLADDYYLTNVWRGQSSRVVIVTEKEGLFDALNAVGAPYGVAVIAAVGGFASVSVEHEIALELQALIDGGQDVTLLYVGDLDPSGVVIEQAFYRALRRYGYTGSRPIRVAVTPEQVPTLPVQSRQKLAGSNVNTRAFIRDYRLPYGYQVEAIPGQRLATLMRQAIERHMDLRALNDAKAVTRAVRAWLTEQVSDAISEYDDRQGASLHERIMQYGALIDDRTDMPLSKALLKRYLAEEGDTLFDEPPMSTTISDDDDRETVLRKYQQAQQDVALFEAAINAHQALIDAMKRGADDATIARLMEKTTMLTAQTDARSAELDAADDDDDGDEDAGDEDVSTPTQEFPDSPTESCRLVGRLRRAHCG